MKTHYRLSLIAAFRDDFSIVCDYRNNTSIKYSVYSWYQYLQVHVQDLLTVSHNGCTVNNVPLQFISERKGEHIDRLIIIVAKFSDRHSRKQQSHVIVILQRVLDIFSLMSRYLLNNFPECCCKRSFMISWVMSEVTGKGFVNWIRNPQTCLIM